MNRRSFLKSIGASAGAVAVAGNVAHAASKTERPNLLLYVVDDQGTNDAGCYGNLVIRTPGLDALAAAGTRFTHGFCTTASCSASRSVLLTGMHNHANGQYGHAHGYNHFVSHPDIETLPVMLAQAGYRSACAGKYHVAPESAYHFGQYIRGGGPAQMAKKCNSFIESDEEPFFLYFCTTEPHRPFHREGSTPVTPEEVIVPDYLPDSPECREELAQYYMSVERADNGLVQLIGQLKAAGKWDNTVIIYLSDNGIAFPGAKTTLYEPGMRLPCVVRDPAQEKKGLVCDAMVTWADITPTLLDYANATPKEPKFQGRSFRVVVGEEETDGWDEIYASHTFHEITMYYPMRVVRTRRYKLLWNIAYGLDYPFASDLWASSTWQGVLERGEKVYGKRSVEAYLHRPEFELYDLKTDPDEIVNLANDPAYAEILRDLKRKLKRFQKRTKDPWILKWEYE